MKAADWLPGAAALHASFQLQRRVHVGRGGWMWCVSRALSAKSYSPGPGMSWAGIGNGLPL